jgi:bacillithiol system protein YtxJ
MSKYTKSPGELVALTELTTEDDVRSFIGQNSLAIIFKAGRCRQTGEALRRLNPFFKKYPDLPAAVIDVVLHTDASMAVTGMSDTKHESPQVLLFKDGKCVFNANHWRIDTISLLDEVERYSGIRDI